MRTSQGTHHAVPAVAGVALSAVFVIALLGCRDVRSAVAFTRDGHMTCYAPAGIRSKFICNASRSGALP